MRLSRLVLYTTAVTMALLFLVPVYVMALTSLKTPADAVLSRMWQFPSPVTFSAWGEAWGELGPFIINTFKLAIPATALSALLGSLNGYVFSKWRFRGSETIFSLLLFGLFIPYQSVLIPLVQTLETVGLYNSITGLILVHVVYGIPITTLIFRNFYARIPKETFEASAVDGAGIVASYWRIALPLSIPGFVVVGIWQFTQVWNEFLFAVTITSAEQRPVMVALQNISGSQIVQFNVQMAGALMAALPTLIVYIFLGRYFVRGMLAGSVR